MWFNFDARAPSSPLLNFPFKVTCKNLISYLVFLPKQVSFEAHDPHNVVYKMVVAGVGVWVSFKACDSIRLFHTETRELLQDISVGSPVGRMIASEWDGGSKPQWGYGRLFGSRDGDFGSF